MKKFWRHYDALGCMIVGRRCRHIRCVHADIVFVVINTISNILTSDQSVRAMCVVRVNNWFLALGIASRASRIPSVTYFSDFTSLIEYAGEYPGISVGHIPPRHIFPDIFPSRTIPPPFLHGYRTFLPFTHHHPPIYNVNDVPLTCKKLIAADI